MITAPPSFGTVLSGFLTQLKCAPAFLLLLSPFVALSLEHPPLGTCLLPGHRSRCINLSLGGQYLRFVTLPRRGSSVIRCRNFPGRETCPLLELENEHPTTGRLYKDTYPYWNSIQCILHWRGTLNTPPPPTLVWNAPSHFPTSQAIPPSYQMGRLSRSNSISIFPCSKFICMTSIVIFKEKI